MPGRAMSYEACQMDRIELSLVLFGLYAIPAID